LTPTGVYDVVITGTPNLFDVRRARDVSGAAGHGQRDAECHLGHVTVTTYGSRAVRQPDFVVTGRL